MIDNKQTISTTENKTASTPSMTPTATSATTASVPTVSMTTTGQTIQNALTGTPTPATLPAGYLNGGSMLDADGVMRSEYLNDYAEKLAQSLKPLSAATFQRAFLTKAKEASKKKVPYSTKKNCASGMVIQAKKLVYRKKDPAPAILLDAVLAATASVTDDATFSALCLHLEAIYTALLCE